MTATNRMRACLASSFLLLCAWASVAPAQVTGSVEGTVRSTAITGSAAIEGVNVRVAGTSLGTTTDAAGRFMIRGVAAGPQRLEFHRLGAVPRVQAITIRSGQTEQVEITMERRPVPLEEVVMTASRAPETVIQAGAAVAVADAPTMKALSSSGQVPLAVGRLPGVDIVQTGMNDFNLNARGFNTSTNRRVLVLQDGRDVSLAFLGSQEWPAMGMPLDNLGRLEIVRGPSSALYGANAYSGVLNVQTPSVRDNLGTRFALAGGDLSSMRGDVQRAATIHEGKWGYRVNGGYSKGGSWNRSRTAAGDLEREYAGAIDTMQFPVRPPAPGFELVPLDGQRLSAGLGSAAVGDVNDISRGYGSARLDHYAGARIVTAEAGLATVENEVVVTGVGRLQTNYASRPWGRFALNNDRLSLSTWYTGRNSGQVALASGATFREVSYNAAVEGQYTLPLWNNRGTLISGGAIRNTHVDSRRTLLRADFEDRSDWFYSAFGQLSVEATPKLRVVGATRVDKADIYSTQVSPKLGLIFSPTPAHAFRATVNRAFQAPNTLELFLSVPAAAPADFSGLEAAFRASPFGPDLAAVPNGTLFTNSAAVPVLALGNERLKVEEVMSYELGYKAQLGGTAYFTADVYSSNLKNFVTALLPGVNAQYGLWTAPPEVPAASRAPLEDAIRQALAGAGQGLAAAALTRLGNGATAIVLSLGNAGRVREEGVELSAGMGLGRWGKADANYTIFNYTARETALFGGQLLPNTPHHKGNFTLSYVGSAYFDAQANLRVVAAYDWIAGVYAGRIPASEMVDLSFGRQLGGKLRATMLVTNLFDQQHYQIFGGSLIERRLIGGLTTSY